MSTAINFLTTSSRSLTIAIDAESANKSQRTGVEEYAFEVIEAMKQEPLRPEERVVLYSPTPLEGPLAQLPDGWESQVLDWPLLRWPFVKGWMQGRVSWELFRRRPHVLFVPGQGLPRLTFGVPIVTTIHDLAFHRIGRLFDPVVRRRVASVTSRSIRVATRLLIVSAFTKKELQSLYRLPEDRMIVTPLGVNTKVYHRVDRSVIDQTLHRLRLGHSFFLYVGRLEKKKNVQTLIRAFELFKQHRGIGDPFELVLVGQPGFGSHEIKTLIERSEQKELIREIGYVSNEDVAALMNIATAFCFSSFYEGFGLPNLEALACGTVLMTSDIPVHHEVAGEAAIFVPPEEAETWAKQMKRLVDDPQIRDVLIEIGSRRVKEFTWQKTAQLTWEVLRNLL